MNRTVLFVVLFVYAIIGIALGIYPELDLWFSSLFFNQQTQLFTMRPWISILRDGSMWVIAAIAAPSVVALVVKLARPRRRLLVPARAILFLLTTLAIGPGLVSNGLLKTYWGRPRPIDVQQFGGQEHFVAWWDPSGGCPKNCSFVSGDVSGATWTLAAAALAPPRWRIFAYSAAAVFGALVGLARMAFGGHFFTDVIFAGLLSFMIIWIVHGLIYRWGPTRLTEASLENAIERHFVKIQSTFSVIFAALVRGFLTAIRSQRGRRKW